MSSDVQAPGLMPGAGFSATSHSDPSIETLLEDVRAILTAGKPIQPGEPVRPADACFAYRLLLGRNPETDRELPELLTATQTFREFMSALLESPECLPSSGVFPTNRALMSEVEGFRFWFNSSDREMGVPMALGMYEPRTTALIKRLVRPGMRCLDLGAQTGFYTCLMASLTGPDDRIYAFEPLRSSFEILERNIAENRFEDRVSAFPLAASSHAAVIEGSRVCNMFVAGLASGGERLQIETCRVDDVVTESIDLIKIDIEGHEPAAIEGMKGLLARCRPVILTEANEYWLRTCSNSSAGDYVKLLSSFGYDVYEAGDTTRRLDGSLRLDTLDVIDLMALPADTSR
jgi:FkbM family methyltransferase